MSTFESIVGWSEPEDEAYSVVLRRSVVDVRDAPTRDSAAFLASQLEIALMCAGPEDAVTSSGAYAEAAARLAGFLGDVPGFDGLPSSWSEACDAVDRVADLAEETER